MTPTKTEIIWSIVFGVIGVLLILLGLFVFDMGLLWGSGIAVACLALAYPAVVYTT